MSLMVSIGANVSELERNLSEGQKKLAKFGKDMIKTGKAMTTAFTVPITAVGGAAIKFAADFEKAMVSSLAIMGDVSEEMRTKMEQAAREVATTTRFSAVEAAESYFYLASAGLDAAQSIEALPRVAAFAQAGNFDMARATDLLTDAQSALGLTVKDTAQNMENMARVSDVLVKANTLANATVEQFSESLTNKAGAALRVLNKDIEEGVAVLAVMADQGLKGAAAGESLNIVLRDLQRAAIMNKEGFAEMNISVYDAEGNMNNMADIIGGLEGALAGMSDEQLRSTLMMLGFQDKSVSAMMALLGTSEAIREYEQDLRNAGGVTQEVADKQVQNFWDVLGLLKDRVIDAGITLGDTLVPILQDVVVPAVDKVIGGIQRAAEWFSNLDPRVQTVILVVAGLLAVLGPLFVIVGMVASALAAISAPIAIAVAAFVGLIAIGTALAVNWDTIRGKASEVWTRITDTVKGAANSIISIANSIIGAFESMINFVARAINSVPSFSIPDWVPLIGGKSFSLPKISQVSLGRIPMLSLSARDGGTGQSGGGLSGVARLATGTNFVPQDMLAFLHKGEAVVPAKYNPATGGVGSSNAPIILQVFLDGELIAEKQDHQLGRKLVPLGGIAG
jgi:TP901 family phage tail tape measure protein